MTAPRVQRFFPLLAALLTILAFLPALNNGFLNWDDTMNFTGNAGYRGLGWTQLKWMWTTQLGGHYIPLSWMTLGLDYKIWGMNPFGYHLTNVLLHAANAALFYFLAVAIFKIAASAESRSRIPVAALFATLVFAVHPLRVESVAWVTERRDLLSGLFFIAAIWAYLHAFETTGKPDRWKFYWICFGCFVLAILSKEIVVTLPAVLLLVDIYPLRRQETFRRILLEKIPFFAVSVMAVAVMWRLELNEGRSDPLAGLPALARLSVPLYNLAFYLWKTIVPLHLSPLYVFTAHKIDPLAAPFALSVCATLAITASGIFLRRKFPALLTVWLTYAVILSPVLGLIANGPQIANDRNTYLACLGWPLLAGAGVAALPRKLWQRTAIPVMAGLIVILAGLTWQQIRIWHDSDALWTQALSVEPSEVAYTNLGEVVSSRGDDLWAMEHFQKAIAMNPDFSPAHIGLGGVLLRMRKPDEAGREFQAVLDRDKDSAYAHNGLACALALQGRLNESVGHFHEALRLRPDYSDARRNLEQVLARVK